MVVRAAPDVVSTSLMLLVALLPARVQSPVPSLPTSPPPLLSLTVPLPVVSCVGRSIDGSTNHPTHGIHRILSAVDSLVNDLPPSGSGVDVPADNEDTTDDGTPTPLPQPLAGHPDRGGVNVCAKPGAKISSETLTPSSSFRSIADDAMPFLRLLLL